MSYTRILSYGWGESNHGFPKREFARHSDLFVRRDTRNRWLIHHNQNSEKQNVHRERFIEHRRSTRRFGGSRRSGRQQLDEKLNRFSLMSQTTKVDQRGAAAQRDIA